MKINVKVYTNKKNNDIKRIDEKNFMVYVKSQPIEGKANKEVENILKKYFQKNVRIIRGKTSKQKLVEVY